MTLGLLLQLARPIRDGPGNTAVTLQFSIGASGWSVPAEKSTRSDHRGDLWKAAPPAANRPRAASKITPKASGTLGSFKPRYEIS